MNLVLQCLLIVGLAGLGSYGLGYASRWFARKTKAIDVPSPLVPKKIHRVPTPMFGGLGIFLVGMIGMILLAKLGFLSPALELRQLIGFGLGATLLLVVGLLDDRYTFPPRVLFPLYIVACLLVVLGGTSVRDITHPFVPGTLSLVWQEWTFIPGVLSFVWPADVLTMGWLLILLFSTKLMDGLDGLVSGQAAIGAGIILLLCLLPTYHLPAIALLSALMLGSYLGFLPSNIHPAKQFLGEAGSTLAGFTLGFLAIASGAKLATAFMALGVALIDVALVIFGRFRRHVPITQGDRTHLHHQLLDAGFSQRRVVGILWSVGLLFGLAALALQTRGKLLLLGLLVILTIGLSIYATKRRQHA